MPSLDIVDMVYQDGVPNPSGLATMHGIALMSYFAAAGIKTPDAINDGDATAASVGAISTPHVFAVGKCMKKLYGTQNKGEAKEEAVGDEDSTATKSSITIMVPGSTAEMNAMKKKLNASHGLLFVSQADGQVRQYGSELFPCHFRVSWGTGTNESYRGYTITATCYGDSVIYTPGLNFTPAEAP
ncbi:hypothetical protein EOD41_10815 [Mucilaginibacter limnophilus]|uniref:Uncharacterized protein n=1 Tax=Mucilaginibacter limnophilus TaxID=1932778 RepID=A0A437MTX0_9SPHI|nr:hypothetical protein [Mucilaginibacter limnophilus]RVU01097.1 hypothetical protein EOD41_10815 [Mucilaginibacter limnophilus]